MEHATAGTQSIANQAQWSAAVLYNGLARYEDAKQAAQHAAANPLEPWSSMWAIPELVEAAVRVGDVELARDAFERLAEATQPCATDFAVGIEARCRALLSKGRVADGLYREATGRLGRTRLRPELARTYLLYGEWLRSEGRGADAREQLRTAQDMFVAIGMEAFAERAGRELVATGAKARKPASAAHECLTPQEAQIAGLASDGRTNDEIGAELFLSPRTVEWHLGKAYSKLGIRSRRELRDALARADGADA